ncbi:MDR family MFS transporter [Actinomadura montaniterrae]|uniref:Multidrug efflux MFS transporter n=1 Tax=Actinomadura montaniterrae TaxID=1803903 RepID=A0A6L3W4J4_9ACTN|nr:MDR family MFS transporter [Actinomadura montaniterrae]KAB2384519.1 multidrug efflux MFS transporter [Actinomadura montaniterrae]
MTGRNPRVGPQRGGLAATAAIVVAGAILTVLDATIVSVAIGALARDLAAPLPAVQWVMTGYALALAAVIPLTGWAAGRFGGKRVWIASLALFTAGSLLCALAWSAPSLIAFRVVQGLGGGMVAPVGMTLVAQAAGPRRMGRAMSLVGVPMMLGPMLGPVLGGLLVSAAAWQWIFLVNVPAGLVTLLLSWRLLQGAPGGRSDRLDVPGLLLLSSGLVAIVYAVSRLAGDGALSLGTLAPALSGAVLLALFAVHALRAGRPLLDLRHLADRTFASAAAIQALLGAVLQGSMLLLPLYYQLVHHESALDTGLLLVPQGAGAALALAVSGRLVDRGLGKPIILTGLPLLAAGLLVYTQAGAAAGAFPVTAALLVMGLGTGCLMAPAMSMAYRRVDQAAIPRATALLNITQRVGGAIGTALYAVVLQHNLDTTGVAAAFGRTFWWPLGLTALAVLPALLLPRHQTPDPPRAQPHDNAPKPANA